MSTQIQETTVLTRGFAQNGRNAEMDNRSLYPTVQAALVDGWWENGTRIKDRISAARRHQGLLVFIIEELTYYCFKGGLEDQHFQPAFTSIPFIPHATYFSLAAQQTAPAPNLFALISKDEIHNEDTWLYEAVNKQIITENDFVHTAQFPVDSIKSTETLTISGFDVKSPNTTIKARMTWENWQQFTPERPYTYTETDDVNPPNEQIAHWKIYVTGTIVTVKCYAPVNHINKIHWKINDSPPSQIQPHAETNPEHLVTTVWIAKSQIGLSVTDIQERVSDGTSPTWFTS
jgi:hypothetical protein